MAASSTLTAFQGETLLSSGTASEVALAMASRISQYQQGGILVFDDESGRVVDLDIRGTREEIMKRYRDEPDSSRADAGEERSPGRPKLGVVGREVTLLPRHWEWLGEQRGGASAALRRLVDAARAANVGADRVRKAKEAADRFMGAVLGDRPGYEEASRALYAGDRLSFEARIQDWPRDLRNYVKRLAEPAFS